MTGFGSWSFSYPDGSSAGLRSSVKRLLRWLWCTKDPPNSHNGSIKHGLWSHLLAWAHLISFVTDLSGLARSWSPPAALWWSWWSLRCFLEAPVDSFPRSAGPLCLRTSYTRLNFDFWACLDSNTDRVPAGLRWFRNTWWTCTRCTRWTRSRTTATDPRAP